VTRTTNQNYEKHIYIYIPKFAFLTLSPNLLYDWTNFFKYAMSTITNTKLLALKIKMIKVFSISSYLQSLVPSQFLLKYGHLSLEDDHEAQLAYEMTAL